MNKWILFFGVLVLARCSDTGSTSPDQNYFVKYFGGVGNQFAVDMVVDQDGSIYILGNSKKDATDSQQVYLAKANSKGEVVWERTLGKGFLEAKDLEFTSDGNLVLVANKLTSANDMDILVMKISKDSSTIRSNMLWSKVVASSDPLSNPNKNDYVNSITELRNGNLIVIGYTDNVGVSSHEWDILNIQLTPDLVKIKNTSWQEYNGNGTKNEGYKLLQNNIDSTFVFGSSNFSPSNSTTDENVWYCRLASKGTGSANTDFDPIFVRKNTEDKVVSAIKISPGYLMSVISTSAITDTLKLYKLEFDVLNFDPSDVVTAPYLLAIGKTLQPKSNICSASGGYLVVSSYSVGSDESNILLTKLSGTLQPIWRAPVIFGGLGRDTPSAVAELPDGKIVVLGTMQLGNPAEQSKIALIKVNSNGRFEE